MYLELFYFLLLQERFRIDILVERVIEIPRVSQDEVKALHVPD